MGYTHYWKQKATPLTAQWAAIVNDFQRLVQHCPVEIVADSDEPAAAIIDYTSIFFNGVKDDGHETMAFGPDTGVFNFCKTARKPYDRLVVALLILAEHHAPGCWSISSDGKAADWQPHLEWMNSLGPTVYALPATI